VKPERRALEFLPLSFFNNNFILARNHIRWHLYPSCSFRVLVCWGVAKIETKKNSELFVRVSYSLAFDIDNHHATGIVRTYHWQSRERRSGWGTSGVCR
jgi:hypothetical protein